MCCDLCWGSSSGSMLALRFKEPSSGDASVPLKDPDCLRERLDSLWVLGGLGLLSLDGGLKFGGGKLLMLWGSTPSGLSNDRGGFEPAVPGNCF